MSTPPPSPVAPGAVPGKGAVVRRGWPAVEACREHLEALHRRVGAPVTARLAWLEHWAVAYPDVDPVLVGVGADAGLRAAALLAVRGGRRGWDITLLGHGDSDHAWLAAEGDAAAAELAAVLAGRLGALRRPWRLHLEQLTAGDPVLSGLADRLRHVEVTAGQGCPLVTFDRGADVAAYGSKNFRKEAGQAQRRAAREGRRMEVRFDRDAAAVHELLPRLATVRRRRDHDKDRLSALDDEAARRLWAGRIAAFTARGEVEVGTAWVDDDLAAYNVAILDGSTYRVWDGRIDPDHRRYWPGQVLDAATLARLAADPDVEVMDLMRGETRYKRRMADAVEAKEQLRAWSSAVVRGVEEGPRQARAWARERREADPRIDRAWRRLKRLTVLRGSTEG